jgi:hypothetical protein
MTSMVYIFHPDYAKTVFQAPVRMLFPSIETGTAMNVRESENYLSISRSFSASK